MGEEEGRVFFRLGAAVEMAVEQREDPCRFLKQLAALNLFLSREMGGGDGFGYIPFEDEFFSCEEVGADGGVEGGHEQRGGDAFTADVAKGNPQTGVSKDEEVVVVSADGARRDSMPRATQAC